MNLWMMINFMLMTCVHVEPTIQTPLAHSGVECVSSYIPMYSSDR